MPRSRSTDRRSSGLDTPLAAYLRATYDLPLPARFYDPKSHKPLIRLTLEEIKNPEAGASVLVALYEKSEGNLTFNDIAVAFILENAGVGVPKKNLMLIVEVIRAYGLDLSTRFGIDKYLTYSSSQLETDRAYWQSTLRAQKDYERQLSKGIEAANQKVEQYPAALLSRPEVQQSNLVFTRVFWNLEAVDVSKIADRDLTVQPIVDRARLTNEDAHDIFSLITVSNDNEGIPYLGFHTPSNNQYRVATVAGGDGTYPTHPDPDEFTYGDISKSELYSDLRGSTSFLSFLFKGIFCLLDLTHSKLILNRVHRDSEDMLTDQIGEVLPFLRIEGRTHRRITARIISPFDGSIAYHILFFDAMLNQSDYVGFKEEGDPQLLKPIKKFYLSFIPRVVNPLTDTYASIQDMDVVLMNRTAANTELITLDKPGTSPYELTRGTAYVEFMVYDVSDATMLRFAMAYLSRMVGRYHQVAMIEYAPYIKEEFHLPITVVESDSSTDAIYSRATAGIRGIDRISHSFPEVFGHNYTRQCPHYPTVKQQLDAEDDESQWLRYPPDGGVEFYFRCGIDHPEVKYPGVMVSKLRNRAKYPLLPCCFRTDQFRPGMRTEVAYRLGSAKASAVSEIDITVASWGPLTYPPVFNRRLLMSSDKLLYRGRLGRIPPALLSIIKSRVLVQDDADEEEDKVVRLGLSETNLVHAAFLAVDPEYQKLSTGSQAERLNYLREYIGASLPHPACLYQELSAEEATPHSLMREDADHPLFSSWTTTSHFRIIEEILGINLYVFMRVTPRENAIESNTYYFEVPLSRSGAPHMRRHNTTRSSVLLYYIRRFEGGLAVDSGVELLVHGSPTTTFSGVWGTSCAGRLAELYSRANQVVSFGVSPMNPSQYVSSSGLHTGDYAAAFGGFAPTSQLIDERGLCRALSFDRFSIVFPGTQPYNLPFSGELKLANYDPTVRGIFGDSDLTSVIRDGVYYLSRDDPGRYVFVPLVRGDPSLPIDTPKTAYTPLSGLSSQAGGYGVHWRTAYTYLRVILFFFSFLYAFSETRDPQTFMSKYVELDVSRHRPHAREIYDFGGLKRVLVLRELTMNEALATIRRLAPTFLSADGKRAVVTSQKIYDSLEYYIRTVRDQTEGSQLRKRKWDLASVISPQREGGASASLLLSSAENDSKTLNFGTPRAVRMWFRSAVSGTMAPTSDSRVVFETIRSQTGVVLFRHPNTGRIWLIPAMTGELRNIAAVCYLWMTKHRLVQPESQAVSDAVVDRLAQHSGEASRLTMMFRRNQSVTDFRRSKSRLLGEEEEDLSQVKHLLDAEEVTVYTYVLTRDNHIELLSDPPPPKRIVLEVLRSGPRRFTPMLSP